MMPVMATPGRHRSEPSPLALRFVDALRQWPWIGTLVTLVRRFRQERLALTAGGLTFTSIISLVPLATVSLAILSAFPIFYEMREALQRSLVSSLIPDSISRQVLGWVAQFSSRANRLGGVSLIALIVSAIALMLTIDRTLNGIWRVRRPRPITQRVLVYWSALTLGPLFVAVSIGATSFALSASRGYFGDMPRGLGFVVGSIDFVLVAAGMTALFKFVPNRDVAWRHAFLGALFVAASLALAKRLLAVWFAAVPTYSAVYGAFATLPIFLIWMYLGWCIVLLGAVIAAYLPVATMKVSRWRPTVGSRFQFAVSILRLLAAARVRDGSGMTAPALAVAMSTDPLQSDEILDVLIDLGWVGRLEEDEPPRHVLLRDPATTPAQPLFGRLLLDPSPDIASFWKEAGFDRLTLADVLRQPSDEHPDG